MKRANLTVPEKLKMQREGYNFFCEHHETANCAIDENIGLTCVHAPNHKTREGCRYWKPVHIERKDELIRLRADLAAVTAERDRLQIMHDEAYISGMKHGWNCCAAGEEERYKNSIENIREQIRRARAALEGVTEKAGAGNE